MDENRLFPANKNDVGFTRQIPAMKTVTRITQFAQRPANGKFRQSILAANSPHVFASADCHIETPSNSKVEREV